MDILAPDSLANTAAPTFDPRENKSFLERMASTPGDIAAAFSAAKQQTEFTQGALTMRDMRSKIYDELAAQVKETTGVALENPTAFGIAQSPQIAELARQRATSGLQAEGLIPDFMAQREADFMQQLRDLKQQQHAKMLSVDVDTPISERIAQRFQANNEAAAKAGDLNWALRFPAEMAGSLVGSTSDPMFWASFTLPMGGVGKTVASRIGSAAVAQGAGMAALEAIKQPVEQELRAQAGMPNNALENIAIGAAGGALLGGAVHGLGEIIGRIRAGSAKPADYEAAAKAGVHIDEPTQQAIAQEAEAARAHVETLKAPETVPEGTARTAFAEGLNHAEDPNAPPPLVDRPVPPGTTDALARKVVGEAQSAGEAIDALRTHDLAYDPAEFDAKIMERARASVPEVFRQADELDNTIASLRQQIADAVNAPPVGDIASGRANVLQSQLDDLQAQLSAITGKRRSSPRARALRDQAAQISGEIEGALASAEQDAASAAAREAERVQTMRLYLNEKINDRARLGPDIASARAAAEAEAEAIGLRRGAIASALASHDPEIRDLGRLASLGEEALKIVKAGDVDPLHGVVVAGSSHDPAQQAELLSVLKQAGPQTVEEARQVVTDHLAAASAPEAAAARMGAVALPARPIKAEIPAGKGGFFDNILVGMPDGSIAKVPRADLQFAAARERFMADVVSACKN